MKPRVNAPIATAEILLIRVRSKVDAAGQQLRLDKEQKNPRQNEYTVLDGRFSVVTSGTIDVVASKMELIHSDEQVIL